MERARATWTDERMDDLARRMDSGFDRVDRDVRSLRTEVDALRTETNARLDSLHRTVVQLGGGIFATFVVGFAGLLLAHA